MAYLISQKNLVFICGMKQLENFYPLNDAQENFSKTRVQISEIKKLIFHWICTTTATGSSFLEGVVDFHPNLLTVPNFGFASFGILYREVLKNKNVDEGIQALKSLEMDSQRKGIYQDFNEIFTNKATFGIIPVVPKKEVFFEELKKLLSDFDIPTKVDWFKAMYLAYNYAMGRTFPSRIAPAIYFINHSVFVDLDGSKKAMLDVYDQFPDLKVISIVRNILSTFGSGLQNIQTARNEYHEYKSTGVFSYAFLIILEIALARTDLYISPDDKWRNKRAVVRFEDLKLYPRETLEKLCEFLMIPCDKSLFSVTANGVENTFKFGASKTSGFDTKSVYDLHKDYAGLFDFYRLEIYNILC